MKRSGLILALLLINNIIYTQCTGTFQFPTENVIVSPYSNTVIITPFSWAGDYSHLEGFQQGETYSFSSSTPDDYITLRDIDGIDIIAHGASPLTHTINGDDLLSMHVNLSSPPCGTESVYRMTTVTCSTCPELPGMTGINNTTPGATLDVAGEIRLGKTDIPPVSGMIRWNDSTDDFEGYNGSQWVSLTQTTGAWGPVAAPESNQNQTVQGSDVQNDDYFGSPVAIHGEYAIVGTSNWCIFGTCLGSEKAYIFKRENGIWAEQAILTPTDSDENDFFGTAVDIHGDYAIVGAQTDEIGSNDYQGSAYIFHRSGNTWTQQAKLTASDGDADDLFGGAVAIHEDYVIIGAKNDHIGSNDDQGSAYIFHRSGNTWTQQAKLTATDGDAGDEFGCSVDIVDDECLIGARGFDWSSTYTNTGGGYVFTRSGSSWSEDDWIGVSLLVSDTYLGSAVALDGEGNYVLSTQYFDSNTGKVRIRTPEGIYNLVTDEISTGDNFGRDVDISEGVVAVTSDIKTFLFDPSTRKVIAKLTNSDNETPRAVGISGSHVITGTYNPTYQPVYFYKKN